jgi:alkyl sulfatase BDS1-like metallo-beta-lactamase superfamily hydrolase
LIYHRQRWNQKKSGSPLSKATLNAVQLKEATMEEKIASGDIKIIGRKEALGEFLGLLDSFPFWFNIVTP